MKSHLQCINAARSWPGPACLLEERSLESNLTRRCLPEHPPNEKQLCFKRKMKIISTPPGPREGLSCTGPPLLPNRLPAEVTVVDRLCPLSTMGFAGSYFVSLAQSSLGKWDGGGPRAVQLAPTLYSLGIPRTSPSHKNALSRSSFRLACRSLTHTPISASTSLSHCPCHLQTTLLNLYWNLTHSFKQGLDVRPDICEVGFNEPSNS